MANLQDWNRLSNQADIIAGRRLTIYLPREIRSSALTSSSVFKDGEGRGEGGAAELNSIIYTVERGATLWDIARAHNVTVSALRKANRLSSRSAIHPGDRLRIVLSASG